MKTLQTKAAQTIRTFVRIKPLINGGNSVVQNTNHEVFAPRFNQDNFYFNEVFGPDRKNEYVFSTIMKPIVQHIFEGYNACILAYGQTSTGKTHTMKGSQSDRGMIPRTIRQIFARIEKQNMVAKVRISYFQIYNENIIDLLSNDNPPRYLDIRDDAKKNAVILDIVQMEVANQNDSLEYYDRGEARRKFASNNINFQSSRSHTIFRITLEVAHEDVSTSTSVIDMVDLAGSESISKTNASGLLKKESENINKSLLALSNVIRSLSQLYDKDKRVEIFQAKYINYRDSKLTRILQPCLTGNSKTLVICTIQQLEECIGETINTLKFGIAANSIKISAPKNVITNPATKDPRYEQLIETLQQERLMKRKVQQQLIKLKKSLEVQNVELKKKVNELAQQLLMQETQNANSNVLINQLKGQTMKQIQNRQNVFTQVQESIKLYKVEIIRLQRDNQQLKMKNQNIKKHNQLLQRNERTLLDKLSKYERQLVTLNESMYKKEQDYKHKLDSKQMIIQKENHKNANKNQQKEKQKRKGENNRFRDNPYTISRIIQLSSRILDMKMQIDEYTKSNMELQDQNQKLVATIQHLKNPVHKQETEKEEKTKQSRASGTSHGQRNSGSRMGEWQIRNMKEEIKSLRAEKGVLKKKIVQMRNTMKINASNHIEQLHGYNRFIDKNFSQKEKEYFEFLFNQSVQQFAPIPIHNPPTNPQN